MARLIDADEFERFLMNLPDEVLCEDCCYVVVNEMRKQPTIEADPVKHGKWIWEKDHWECSECRGGRYHDLSLGLDASFCGRCGARMDGE